ncbi:conserved domain protein [Bacteroides ovatus SD CMC 3f]|nr:conserved domain protein [Bacteroides ovatus SD CMC 3f]
MRKRTAEKTNERQSKKKLYRLKDIGQKNKVHCNENRP